MTFESTPGLGSIFATVVGCIRNNAGQGGMRLVVSFGIFLALVVGCVSMPISDLPPTTTVLPQVTAYPTLVDHPQTALLHTEAPTRTPLSTRVTTMAAVLASPLPPPSTFTPSPSPRFSYRPYDLVLALDWSPDGHTLAVASGENVHLYDGTTLLEQAILPVGVWVNGLAFSPQSNVLALAVRDGSVQLWDVYTSQQICSYHAHLRGANSVAFDPAGGILASTGNDAIVKFWDIANLPDCDLPLLAQTIGASFGVPAIRYSPTGEYVASIDRHMIRLRNAADQRLVRTFQSGVSIFSIAFNSAGSLLASGEISNTVRLWDVNSGELVGMLVGTEDPKVFVWGVDFSPDGRWLATGTNRGVVTLWEIATQKMITRFTGPQQAVTSLAFSPNGQWLAAGSLDAVVWMWEVKP